MSRVSVNVLEEEAYESIVCRHYARYSAGHRSTVYKYTTIIGCPILLYSIMGMFLCKSWLALVGLPSPSHDTMDFATVIANSELFYLRNPGVVLLAPLIIPLMMEVRVGALTCAIYAGIFAISSKTYAYLGEDTCLRLFASIIVTTLTLLIFSKIFYEKKHTHTRSIREKVSVLYMFNIPFFVVLQLLFYLGYKPYLMRACERTALELIKSTRTDKKNK
eukprot:GHVR01107203.1.p1 GENE.GHVR01107203.1~~GHVR01107203.1.p1  ORF type:complete len:219 (+),score=33.50 GHVR01107203.1:19-675(+)